MNNTIADPQAAGVPQKPNFQSEQYDSTEKTGSKPLTLGSIVFYHAPAIHGAKAYVAPAIVSRVNDDGTAALTIFQPNVTNTFEPFVGEGYVNEHGWQIHPNDFRPMMPNSSEPMSAQFWNGKVDVGYWGWPELEPEVRAKVVVAPKIAPETKYYADESNATGLAPISDHSPEAPEVDRRPQGEDA